MENILTIDNGNSCSSIGRFKHGTLKEVIPLISFLKSETLLPYHLIMADVGPPIPELQQYSNIIRVKNLRRKDMFLDMPVNYASTLGEDRLATSYYIYKEKIEKEGFNKAVLVDSGTFITIDIIGTNGHMGGLILPGIQTFLNAYSAGVHLPKLTCPAEFNMTENSFDLPNTTEKAILESCKLYLRGTLQTILSKISPVPRLYLTGGQESYLAKTLNDILPDTLIERDPYMLHKGLYNLKSFTNQSSLGNS